MQSRESRLRETTTNSGLGLTFPVTTSVELWTSTRELRNFRRCHPCKLKCYIGILGFERRRQSRVLDRTLQLLVQLCFGLRRETLEIFVDAFHASINEQLVQTYDGIFGFGLKCRVGILGVERRQQSRVLDRTLQLLVRLCFGLRRENLEIFADAIHASINEQLIQIYDGIFGFRLKCRVGILGFERRQQSRVLDRPLQLLVRFINEQLVQTYDGIFGFRLKCRVGILAFERRRQSRVLDRPLKLLVQLCCGLRRENLEIFADAIHASINEQLIQIYDGTFGFRLKCRVGKLGFERRRQSRVLDRTFQLLVQLCFGLRRENLEIFADAIHASINEQLIQIYDGIFGFRLKCRVGLLGFERGRQSRVLDRPLLLLVQLCFGLRREKLDNFRGCHPYNVFGCGLKCRVGIVGFGRRQQIRGLDRPLLLLVQLCFGLRRENLEIFADAIHASINEQLIQIYDGIFGFRLKCRVEILAFERGRQSRVLDRPLLLLVQLCFGLRRENLEIFADAIHASINEQLIQIYNSVFGCGLKCRVGIVGFGRRQQIRVLDRPLLLLIQLCFGLRRENLEIFADAIHASINEQLIQIYDGIFGFRLKCRVEILAFERGRQSRVLDRPLLLLDQLCFGLRRENLEIFADAIHASINEQLIQIYDGIFGFRLKCRRGRQSRVLDRPLLLLVQLCFGLRRENLEIFADAIHASINEQLIQIYDGIFGFRLKCRVETLAFERGRQSRVLDRPLLLLVQLCFGLRRENLEIFADAIHASINEQLIHIYNSVFGCGLRCRVGIVGSGRRQQIRGLDRPLLLLVQLCFGLRRENLEIFADTIHASINEQLIHIYNCFFGF
ncbi:hypothetical protein V1477_006672 [Vespula maculifrons]|uniref:Uncharacterized protein n=1 Tax=Vespula maculifrons TaxID=7453 RepID=A0ABD2CKI4_VESMC